MADLAKSPLPPTHCASHARQEVREIAVYASERQLQTASCCKLPTRVIREGGAATEAVLRWRFSQLSMQTFPILALSEAATRYVILWHVVRRA